IVFQEFRNRPRQVLLLIVGRGLEVDGFTSDATPGQTMALRVVHVDSQLASVDCGRLPGSHAAHTTVPTALGPTRTVSPVRFIGSESCLCANSSLIAKIEIGAVSIRFGKTFFR